MKYSAFLDLPTPPTLYWHPPAELFPYVLLFLGGIPPRAVATRSGIFSEVFAENDDNNLHNQE